MVEHLLAKEKVAGSNPVFRSNSPVRIVEHENLWRLLVSPAFKTRFSLSAPQLTIRLLPEQSKTTLYAPVSRSEFERLPGLLSQVVETFLAFLTVSPGATLALRMSGIRWSVDHEMVQFDEVRSELRHQTTQHRMKAAVQFAVITDGLTDWPCFREQRPMKSDEIPIADDSQRIAQRLEQELTQRLIAYIEGTATLHDLRTWIADQPWAMPNPGTRLINLYGQSHSRIIRFDKGTWTEHELRTSLRYLLETLRTERVPGFRDPLMPVTPSEMARDAVVTLRPKKLDTE